MKAPHTELIWKYLDGTCSPSEKASIEALFGDPEFKSAFDSAKEIHEGLNAQPEAKVPLGFTARVMAEVAVTPLPSPTLSLIPKSFFYKFLLMPAGIAAAFLIFMLVGPADGGSQYITPYLDMMNDWSFGGATGIIAAIACMLPLLVLADQWLKSNLKQQ